MFNLCLQVSRNEIKRRNDNKLFTILFKLQHCRCADILIQRKINKVIKENSYFSGKYLH